MPLDGEVVWADADGSGDPIVAYERGAISVVANVADDAVTLGPGAHRRALAYTTSTSVVLGEDGTIDLPPRSAAIVVRR
jgi:hypothetical protein